MQNELTPEQYVNLIKIQCPIGYNNFYDKYSSFIYGICLNAVKSESLANKILQECFVNIYLLINDL